MTRIALINHDAERLWEISRRLTKQSFDVLVIVELVDACILLPVFQPHVILYDHGNSERLIAIFNDLYDQENTLKLLITERVKLLENLSAPFTYLKADYTAASIAKYLFEE